MTGDMLLVIIDDVARKLHAVNLAFFVVHQTESDIPAKILGTDWGRPYLLRQSGGGNCVFLGLGSCNSYCQK